MIRPNLDESKLPEVDRPDLVDPDPQVRDLEPLAVGKSTACQLLSVSSRTLDRLEEMGLPTFKGLGKRLYPIREMREWIAEQAHGGRNES